MPLDVKRKKNPETRIISIVKLSSIKACSYLHNDFQRIAVIMRERENELVGIHESNMYQNKDLFELNIVRPISNKQLSPSYTEAKGVWDHSDQ